MDRVKCDGRCTNRERVCVREGERGRGIREVCVREGERGRGIREGSVGVKQSEAKQWV